MVSVQENKKKKNSYRSSETDTDLSLTEGFTSLRAATKSSIEIGGNVSSIHQNKTKSDSQF
jgi:hypothetical protein